jgi:hypothetical protein
MRRPIVIGQNGDGFPRRLGEGREAGFEVPA